MSGTRETLRACKPLLKAAEEQGWTIIRSSSGMILRSPDGVSTAGLHMTPRDHRWLKNFRRDLRRGGLEV